MSHGSFSLPIRFEYVTVERWLWGIRKDGSLNRKNLRTWGSPLVLAPARYLDPWEMRREFLELPHSNTGLLEFLNRTAYWGGNSPTTFDDYWSWQGLIRGALLSPGSAWPKLAAEFGEIKVNRLRQPLNIRVQWEGNRYFGEVKEWLPLDVILATVRIDKIMDARFGSCARSDCRKIYVIRTQHKRKYCSQYCAHIEGVRRDRREMAKRKRRRENTR